MPRFALIEEDDSSSNSSSESGRDQYYPTAGGDGFVGTPPAVLGQSRYCFDEDEDDDLYPLNQWNKEPRIGDSTQEALLQAHVNTDTVPMKTLIKYAVQDASAAANNRQITNNESSVQGLEDAMTALTLYVRREADNSENRVPNPIPVTIPKVYARLGETERQIRQEILEESRKYDQQHEKTRREIQVLLDQQQKEAELRLEQQRQAERQAQAERAAEERQKQELERQKRAQEEKAAAERAAAEEIARQKLEQQRAAAEKRAAEKAAKEQAEKAAKDYLARADKIVAQLVQLRASVEPFEKSKPMGRRRLEMKKVVNGKVNTLSEDVDKIKSVAADVAAAITKAKEDDKQIAEQIEAGNAEFSSEMTKGKRYLVDLLCAKVIVRVQAEGFNGQRGDGFPLAHMLSIVAVEHKDIVPILAAHVYTVCPTAIPRLPTPAQDASEAELMDSLGMQKDAKGEYETFERFLARTEGLISMLADIMASEPTNHPLLNGQQGGIKWLSRFLSELPAAPVSPLPLITAPVLDAFLTGAGHMLANAFADEFRKCLDTIAKDVVPRLDEGAVGKPSATRLQKTLEGGFDAFKTTLPSRALGELYHGSTATGARKPSSSAPGLAPPKDKAATSGGGKGPFGGGSAAKTGSSAPNPFGGGVSSAGSPFGGGGASAASTNSPFGQASSKQSTSAPSPFGGGGASSAPSPFGGGGGAASASPFGPGTAAPGSSPFGPSGPAPSPFGPTTAATDNSAMQSDNDAMQSSNNASSAATPFGAGGGMGNPSPFGGAPAPASTFGAPFGSPAPASAFGGLGPNPSPFGSPPAAAAPAPFGAPAPAAPFGAAPAPSSFGAPSPSPFSGGFGGGAPAAPFGSSNPPAPTPFSGAAPSPSPFGTFGGSAASQSPFGAPAPSAASASPFGSPPAPAGPFGAPSQPSPFGAAAPGPSGFGGGGGSAGGQTPDNRPPCKFFAQGRCRYGNNCKFSHADAGGGGGGSSFSDPFGGGPRR